LAFFTLYDYRLNENRETSISIIDGIAQGQSITNDSINRLLAETRAFQNTMLESNLAATQNIDNLRKETRAGFQGLDKDINDIAAMTLAMNAGLDHTPQKACDKCTEVL
jgi:hypothetical protein